MGMDFHIHRGCPAQLELGERGFLQVMKRRRLSAILEGSLVVDGVEREVSVPDEGVAVTTVGPDGVQSTHTLTRESLEQQAAALRAFERDCRSCPANLTGSPFGCYGFISYPLEAETERWLHAALDRAGADAVLVSVMLKKLGVDGSQAAQLRTQRHFFQSTQPLAVRFQSRKPGAPDLVVDTNLLCELLFFGAAGQHLHLACALLGLLPEGRLLYDDPKVSEEQLIENVDVRRLAAVTPQQQAVARFITAQVSARRQELGFLAEG